MAQYITSTEQFDTWDNLGCTVTANTQAAPAFAGINATLADTVADLDGASPVQIRWSVFPTIVAATDHCLSIHIPKTFSAPTVFPLLYLQWLTGTGGTLAVSINTQDGTLIDVSSGASIASKGTDNVDAVYWRVWFVGNSGTNIDFRPGFLPAQSDTHGGSDNGASQNSPVLWGVNFTDSSTLLPYVPEPFYEFVVPAGFRLVRFA